jgi:tetratricopeptide (TPR) repeat protein
MARMFWSKVNLKRQFAIAALIKEVRILLKSQDFPKAEVICARGLAQYPDAVGLLSGHAEIPVREGNWPTALERLERLLEVQGSGSERDKTVLKMARVCVALGQPAEAEARITAGLAVHPDSFALRYGAAKVATLGPGGLQNATVWRNLAAIRKLRRQKDAVRIPLVAACVAGLRVAGYPEEARALLAAHFDPADAAWGKYAKDGYARLVVFDNGKTRVDFLTKLFDAALQPAESRRLVITFDIMTQTWDGEPYTYKALSRSDHDFLAVRKRTTLDFHQDFHRDDFLRVAAPVAARYPDVVAFGQSLGGYSALYYATLLPQCRILATAPRNPLNPKYSGIQTLPPELFLHELDMPRNEAVAPTIVFDPKNAEDGRYVTQSLRPAFPQARFVPYPYTGHSITRYLLEAGILKNTTLGFCDGIPFPDFDRRLRGNSAEYLRNLARRNFGAGRKKWALTLALRAKELGTYPERTDALLKKLGYELPAG